MGVLEVIGQLLSIYSQAGGPELIKRTFDEAGINAEKVHKMRQELPHAGPLPGDQPSPFVVPK